MEEIRTLTESIGFEEGRTQQLIALTAERRNREPSRVRQVMTAAITAFGCLIVGTGVIAFLAVTLNIKSQLPLFLIISAGFFPAAFYCLSHRLETVGMTLMLIGLIASGAVTGIPAERQVALWLFPLWFVVAVLAMVKQRQAGAIFTGTLVVEVYLFVYLIGQLEDAPFSLSLAVLVNLIVVVSLWQLTPAIPFHLQARLRPVLLTATVLAATLFAFILTFEGVYDDLAGAEKAVLTAYNVLFFAVTGAMVWFGRRQNSARLVWIGGVFWFAFLFYKYYDLLWNLLDKSLALILLGVIFIAASWVVRRGGLRHEA